MPRQIDVPEDAFVIIIQNDMTAKFDPPNIAPGQAIPDHCKCAISLYNLMITGNRMLDGLIVGNWNDLVDEKRSMDTAKHFVGEWQCLDTKGD